MKKLGFLMCFFILSCVYFLHGVALEDLKASKHLTAAQEEKHERNGSGNNVNLHTTTGGDDEEFVAAKAHAFFPNKAQRGKGSYGGANVVHHPNEKSAASTLQSPSTTNFYISFSLVLILPLLIT